MVGILQFGAKSSASFDEAVRNGLRQYGLVDGQNVRVVMRYADNDAKRVVELAGEFATQGCRVIVTQGTTSVRAAHTGAPNVPVVMAPAADPVEAGFAQSLARPGGKITGIAIFGAELIIKTIEILKEAVPGARSFAVLMQAANPGNPRWRSALSEAEDKLGVRIHVREVVGVADFQAAFDWAADLKVDGIFLPADPVFTAGFDTIVSLALAHRLPAITGGTGPGANAGLLMSYAQGTEAILNRAGYYVSQILKGVDPGALPIERPSAFRLVINLKTAKAIGITISPTLLVRADEVIE